MENVEFNKETPLYSGLYKSIIQYIDIDKLTVPKRPPVGRRALDALSASVAALGFLRPLFVTKDLAVADGARRLSAALSLGARRVPFVYYPNPFVFEDDLIITRLKTENVPFFDYAEALRVLTDKYLYSQEDVAAALGRSQSFVANKLRLLSLTADERRIIADGDLTERHARASLKIKDAAARTEALKVAAAARLGVAAAEDYFSSVASDGNAGAGTVLLRELDSVIKGYTSRIDVTVSSSPSPDGGVIYTVKIPT